MGEKKWGEIIALFRPRFVIFPALVQNRHKFGHPSKNIPNSRPEYRNHTITETKIANIYTLFQTKKTQKPLAPHMLLPPSLPPSGSWKDVQF